MRRSWLAGLLLLTSCAGESGPELAGPPRDVGHGSFEEVVEALSEQGVPCSGVETADPSSDLSGEVVAELEQAVVCTLDATREKVLLVHFFDEKGAAAFEERSRAEGLRGVYAATWAARPETSEGVDILARALQNRGRS